jgi:ATPase involved in DNA repair
MIPVQLQLKNFMSYGENVPPLRFEGMHVVCFSGANGHGKSALLDAITWALWGRSRARSDDDLIRHGRTEMMVDFEFQLEGLRYRVRRERVKRSKRSQGALEFYVWDAQSGQWRPLTESSMRATQRRIVETLKLDYETFINSAYLKQGQADEFTTRTPGERKRIWRRSCA